MSGKYSATRFREKEFSDVSTPGSLHDEFIVVADAGEEGEKKGDISFPYGSLFFVLPRDVPFPAGL